MKNAPAASVAFDVFHNGRKICAAGLRGRPGVISAILSWVGGGGRDELRLHVGALDSAAEEHVTWLNRRLRMGDEVVLRITQDVEISRVPPGGRKPASPRGREEKKWLRATAKKHGYRLVKA